MSSPDPSPNPYAAPRTDLVAPPPSAGDDLTEAEAIRQAHLGHETSIKQIGTLHYLGAFFGILVVMGLGVYLATARRGGAGLIPMIVVLIIYLALSGLNAALGIGLRRLQPWARWVEAALVGLGLLVWLMAMVGVVLVGAAPLAVAYLAGILFQAYILYLLLSPKGSVVFSASYREVIAQTPHVRYRMSWVVKLALGVFLVVMALAALGAFLAQKG